MRTGAAVAASPESKQVSDQVRSELTKSFASAGEVARQHPQYADQIVAAARRSFLHGDDWAYAVGLAAIAMGALLVFFKFPHREAERELLRRYETEDSTAARAEGPRA
ncbi:hypothetical protein [Streptomyces sp. NPDC058623]|uniref:hypothetical protein n=1 Tax=Streptomyces sp. NPDC058623 TaxID=3346563 RepID=UPI003651D760